MMKKLLFILSIATSCFASTGSHLPHIEYEPEPTKCPEPWFTGPLLASSGRVVPIGYYNIEPYFFYTVITGGYDSNWKTIDLPTITTANFQFLTYFGLTKWADILITPQGSWTHVNNVSSLTFGDFITELDIQLYSNDQDKYAPALKFYLQETFPTGKYDRGRPEKLGTDIGGTGSFHTTFGLVLSKLFEFPGCQFLSWRLDPFFTLTTKVDVRGISFYGGAPNTNGTVTPPMQIGLITSFEYSFTQNWVFSIDLEGLYATRRKFKGFPGFAPNAPNLPLLLSLPERFSFSMAPAVEYNFNSSFGIIGGCWFTYAGKNTPKFYSIVLAVNYYGPLSPKPKKLKSPIHGSLSAR